MAVLDILSSWVSDNLNRCRCTKAKVIDILVYNKLSGEWICYTDVTEGCYLHDNHFLYRKGDIVKIETKLNVWKKCDEGIHFFLLKDWAINYA